jgi:hypothetical protein
MVSDIPAGDGKITFFYSVVKSREMTYRSQALPWWLAGGRGKDDRNQNTLAPLRSRRKTECAKLLKGRKGSSGRGKTEVCKKKD